MALISDPDNLSQGVNASAEVVPPNGDEEMATFNTVGLRAKRNHGNRTVVVDVDVELATGAAGIVLQLHRASSKQYSDGSSLACELIVTDGAGGTSHSDSQRFPHGLGRKYAVLLYQGVVISVVLIHDG